MDPLTAAALILILLCFFALSWFAGSDAPYVATGKQKISRMLKAAGIKKGLEFYELGSGDGRIVLEAARLGAIAHGIEQSWIRVWYSRYRARKENLQNAYFYHGDIFHRHYFPADVVYIFLLPKAVEKLESKLKKELKTGAIIITQTFHFKRWKPFMKIAPVKNDPLLARDKGLQAGDFWFYKKT